MPVIAIIAIVAIVIILNKTGVSDSLTALTLATVAALLTGGGAAGAASVALTPFVGVPVFGITLRRIFTKMSFLAFVTFRRESHTSLLSGTI